MRVMEPDNIFKQEQPQEKIGKSSFAALSPPDVLLTLGSPRNVCVQKNHENLIVHLEYLHKFDERLPQCNSSITLAWVCSEESAEFWFNRCEDYKDGKLFQRTYPFPQDNCATDDGLNFVSWYQWEKIQNDKCKIILEQIHKDGTIRTLYEKLIDVLPSLQHTILLKNSRNATKN